MIDFFKQNIGQKVSAGLKTPLIEWLDGTLHEAEVGQLTFKHTVKPEYTNPMGTLHGGIIATFLDDVIGATVYSLGKEYFYVSVNLNLDYLNPARLGDEVLATAFVTRNGENIIHLDATLKHLDGRLIAKATTNMVKTKIKRT